MKYLILFLLSFNLFAGVGQEPIRDMNNEIVVKLDAFAAKSNHFFRGHGIKCLVAASATTACEYTVTYNSVKFNGAEIIGGSVGDTVNFKILDTPTGTYTLLLLGVAVPNGLLNQFGFDWNLADRTKEIMPYVSDLNIGMRIVIEVTNAGAEKTLGMNFYLHESK